MFLLYGPGSSMVKVVITHTINFMHRSWIFTHIFTSVHNKDMRTRANINIDNDAYNAATAYAAARGLALGAAISELIRRAEQAPELPVSASPKLKRNKHGILVVKAAGRVITSEIVREESEDDLG